MAIRMDEATHTYYDGDRVIPGVTSILKATGVLETRWFTKAGRDAGTSVHEYTEMYDAFGAARVRVGDEKLQPFLDAYVKFRAETGFELVEMEKLLYSEEHGFAGTCDRIFKVKGTDFIVDIKKGGRADWHPLQLAAYALARGGHVKAADLYLRESGRYSLEEVHASDLMNAKLRFIDLVRQYKSQAVPA